MLYECFDWIQMPSGVLKAPKEFCRRRLRRGVTLLSKRHYKETRHGHAALTVACAKCFALTYTLRLVIPVFKT